MAPTVRAPPCLSQIPAGRGNMLIVVLCTAYPKLQSRRQVGGLISLCLHVRGTVRCLYSTLWVCA